MTEHRVLVLYGTNHGHTAKIARHLGEQLEVEGCSTALRDAAKDDPDPTEFDAVIVVASVHAGKHQRDVVTWVKGNLSALDRVHTAFVSSSLTEAEPSPDKRLPAQEMIETFTRETGWAPSRTKSVAGALQYREYGFLLRQVMRRMMRKGDHPTDTSRDFEYTDWTDLDLFARQFAEELIPADELLEKR